MENAVKSSYNVFKNSASRQIKLAKIARDYEQKSLKPRNIFEIKYLTSELGAARALMVDYLQIMKITSDLSKDTKITIKGRKKMKTLCTLLQDSRVLIGLVALHSILGDKGVAPYQLWAQRVKACAFERLFRKTKLYSRLNALNEGKLLSEESMDVLAYIDYSTKTWKKTGFKVNYCPRDIDESKTKVIAARAEIATKFRVAKERVHRNSDPPFLDDLSKIIRNWDFTLYNENFKSFEIDFFE